jgi:hypothetical protein
MGDGGGCGWTLEAAGHIRVGGGAERGCKDAFADHSALTSSFAGGERQEGELTYLAGLPHRGSPLILSTLPRIPDAALNLQCHELVAYIPRWRGEAEQRLSVLARCWQSMRVMWLVSVCF